MTARAGRIAAALIAACGLSCATAGAPRPDGPTSWGAALRRAARDRGTWVPAAGAALVAAGGWDARISRWATRKAPLFGSPARASRWSDRLRGAAHLGMDAAALAVPGSWRVKGGRLLLDHAAAVTATSLTAGLKRATRRRRPDGSDRESFPSGHASRAFAYAAAGRVDLEESALPPGWRCALGAGLTALAAGTAWARVEAGVHFPTDVLAGAALGNFTARVMHERFAGRGREVSVAVDRRRGGWSVGVTLLWGAPPPR